MVTGAGRGLGLEMARALARAGARVIITGRTAGPLQDAAATIPGAAAMVFDMDDDAERGRAVARAEALHGRLDILVNNVGARDRRGIGEFDDASIRALLDTDLVASIALSRDAARAMQRRGWGRIISVSSIVGPMARPGDGIYPIAKSGVDALTRVLAVEYGPHGITANGIAPGMFATETNAALVVDQQMVAFTATRVPAGRWGRPDEIAGAAVFLASDAASYVNGHVLVVDGGHSVRF